jgi:hypothetical protein
VGGVCNLSTPITGTIGRRCNITVRGLQRDVVYLG